MQERHFALDDNGPPCNDGSEDRLSRLLKERRGVE